MTSDDEELENFVKLTVAYRTPVNHLRNQVTWTSSLKSTDFSINLFANVLFTHQVPEPQAQYKIREIETLTSWKIKANEKTSTFVSYSSFLKSSGATYLPDR